MESLCFEHDFINRTNTELNHLVYAAMLIETEKIIRRNLFYMYEKKIRRGDIYLADLNPVVGSEKGDCRPVLIVQNNVGNEHSPTTIVLPLTRNLRKNPLPTHVLIPKLYGLDGDSLVLVEQIRTIDRIRLRERIGHISRDLQLEIDKAIIISVGLDWRLD